MALSREHLVKHVVEIQERFLAAGDSGGGGHSGVSLNIYCGILGETPERLVETMLAITYGDLPEEYRRDVNARSRYFRPDT